MEKAFGLVSKEILGEQATATKEALLLETTGWRIGTGVYLQSNGVVERPGRYWLPMKEEDQVVHLPASLPESFNVLVTALESNADVPKMEAVTECLLQEERK